MPLISGVVGGLNTVVTGNNGNGNAFGIGKGDSDKTSNEEAAAADETPATETPDAVDETAATEETGSEGGAASGGNASGTSYSYYATPKEETPAIRVYQLEDRDIDKVVAIDWARRAAIAAQSKMQSETLLEDISAEPFSLMTYSKDDGASSYGKSESYVRPADKAELKA